MTPLNIIGPSNTREQWRHNGRDSVSNHQPRDCLLNRLFKCRSKKTSKLRVTGPCAGNSPANGEFPAQMASDAENASSWWRLHDDDILWWSYSASNHRQLDDSSKSFRPNKLQNFTSLVRGIYQWRVDSPHKGPAMRKMLSYYIVVMIGEISSMHHHPRTNSRITI